MKRKSATHRPKKRRARDFDRAFAAELARLYREQHPRTFTPGVSTRRRSSEIEIDGQRITVPWDIAGALEWFAEHGTWEKSPADIAKWNALSLTFWYRQKRGRGMTRSAAKAELVEETGLGESTVQHTIPADNEPSAREIRADERVPPIPTLSELIAPPSKPT
jgi:hypothetical protein